MGYNLTNEAIQNTYQQLVQVSGSTLLNGTGSAISFTVPTASFAVTSSYALVAQTASYALYAVSASHEIIKEVSSSHADMADSASYADYAVTASYALNVPTIDTSSLTPLSTFNAYTSSNDASVAAKLPTSTFNTYTSSNDASVAAKLPTSTFNTYTSSNDSVVDALVAATSSYLTSLPSGVVSSSAQTVSNLTNQSINLQSLVVQGTASFGYIQSVTGSAKIIGDAFIILNNDTPTQPKGGISVVDSGSTNTTSSFLWDGDSDDWKYEYHIDGTHESAVALFGSGSMIGTTVYPTANKLQKGTGTHHLHDSSISDNGSTIDMTSGSFLKAPSVFQGGNASNLSGNRRFAFGQNNSVGSDDSAVMGGEANTVNASYCGVFGASSANITSGDTSVIIGGYQNTINGGLRNVTIGGQSVTNNKDFAIVLGKDNFTTPRAYTTYMNSLDASGSMTLTGSFELSGQLSTPVFAGSVVSSTSSVDFNNGNFATLSLTSGTHIANPSNLKSGTTYTIIISSGSLIDSMGSAFKFAGGTAPTFSNGTDVLTMVSDGTSLYATALTDFQ